MRTEVLAGLLAVALIVLTAGAVRFTQARRAPHPVLRLTSWNVENLFDPFDDPENPWDRAFTPLGWARWTEEKYERKVGNLTVAMARMAPDIIVLQEVENMAVLDALRTRLRRDHAVELPYAIHRQGADFRGMDVAMLSRFPPVEVQWIAPLPERRDILIVRFMPYGTPLTVIGVHLKSWFGEPDHHQRVRAAEADVLRRVLVGIEAAEPGAAVAVAGDFNDPPGSDALVRVAGILDDRARVAADPDGVLFYHLSAELDPRRRGTYYFAPEEQWNAFDGIAVSRSMLPETRDGSRRWRVRPGTYGIIRPGFLLTRAGHPRAFRRTPGPDGIRVYDFGYSDHLPVGVTIELKD